MTLGELTRNARGQLKWTQSQLAERLGVTPSFITKLEKNEAPPSYDRLLALADVLVLDREQMFFLAEQLRHEHAHQRILKRGATARGTYGLAGESASTKGSQAPPTPGHPSQAEQIGQQILSNPDLKRAFTWLREALADPARKQAVLQMLEAFAQQAKTTHNPNPPIAWPANLHDQPVKREPSNQED